MVQTISKGSLSQCRGFARGPDTNLTHAADVSHSDLQQYSSQSFCLAGKSCFNAFVPLTLLLIDSQFCARVFYSNVIDV